MTTQPETFSEGVAAADRADDRVVDYCARPNCRREFRRSTGPGRPRDYCSDTCRRSAQKELRIARLRLARFEALVEQFRKDVAAFTADSDDVGANPSDSERLAREAVAQAKGAMPFLSTSDDPGARAFVALFEGVAPYVNPAKPA